MLYFVQTLNLLIFSPDEEPFVINTSGLNSPFLCYWQYFFNSLAIKFMLNVRYIQRFIWKSGHDRALMPRNSCQYGLFLFPRNPVTLFQGKVVVNIYTAICMIVISLLLHYVD